MIVRVNTITSNEFRQKNRDILSYFDTIFVRYQRTNAKGVFMELQKLIKQIEKYINENYSELTFIDLPDIRTTNNSKGIDDFQEIEFFMDKNISKTFAETLFSFIDARGLTDSEVYRKAGINRRVFSDIRCKKESVPTKRNILAICLGLELNIDDANILLKSAGYALSNSNKLDLIFRYCIEHRIYSVMDVNTILAHFDIKPFNI